VVLVQKRVGKERGQLFAMKILRKTHLVKRRQIERTRTERKVLSSVNHPFIMKLHYAFQTQDKLYLVLDYCPGGELFFHLSRCRRFPERVARFYAAELLLAIGHLHKRGIIYRDLKPENVLLDAEGHVKLGDFGLAKAGITDPFEGATSICGTPEYLGKYHSRHEVMQSALVCRLTHALLLLHMQRLNFCSTRSAVPAGPWILCRLLGAWYAYLRNDDRLTPLVHNGQAEAISPFEERSARHSQLFLSLCGRLYILTS
jgi:tRNA A-37 threonylcarbamoyl transferase component Bud32